MSTLWIVAPLLEEPSARELADLAGHPLFMHADALARARTGAALDVVATASPDADWARARLRALSVCLHQARAAMALAPKPRAVAGVGLGEIAALALCGTLRDEDALDVMLATALGLASECHGLTLIARGVPKDIAADGVELSRIGEADVLAEGDPRSVGALLVRLHEAGARVWAPWHGPVTSAQRARASRKALASVPRAAPSAIAWIRSGAAEERDAPEALAEEPLDLLRVFRCATSLGCTGYRVLGAAFELKLPASATNTARRSQAQAAPGYYIGNVLERGASSFVAERVISLEAEPYFVTAARLNKTSVLPGSFELEIGIEVGRYLHPDLVPVSIENAIFHSAMKLFEGQPVTMRLKAVTRPLANGRHSVTLSITSDLVHKSGRVLQADRKHCDLTVIMGASFDEAPALMSFDEAAAVSDPDVPRVLYQSGSPLWLGRYFEAVWDTHRSGQVVRSTYRNPADLSLPAFGEHIGAPLLMDAVLQNPLRRNGPYLSVGIPASIRRVRLFGLVNEREICERYGHLVLSSVVDDSLSYCERMQASTPDGRVLLEVERFELISLGYIDRRDLSVHGEVSAAHQGANGAARMTTFGG